jgi:hypothetical protein
VSAAAAQQFATSDNVILDQSAQPYVKALKAAAASDGAFLHYPRPPGIPGAMPNRRDYLNHNTGHPTPSTYLNSACDEMEAFPALAIERVAPRTKAELRLSVEHGFMSMQLTPKALRELARMCIDAAHDIEDNP